MIHFARRTAVVAGAFVLAGALVAQAEELTIVSKTSAGKGQPTTTTQYLGETKVRTSDGDSYTIFDLSTGKMTFVDEKKKEYWETSVDEMAAMFKQLDEQMKSMGGLGGLMEKMGGGAVGDVTVEKGSQAKQVAGYDTQHWIVSMGDGLRYEIWAAPGLKAPTQYYDAMKARWAPMGPMARRFEKIFEEMKKIDGFPLASSMSMKMMGRSQTSTSEAVEVKKGSIPDAVFTVPAGYKKKDSPMKDMAG